MHTADWIVLSFYLIATVGIGILLGRKVKNTADLFAAGGASPWWASGLSAFMTMFSANTFVVWGGMAYEHGRAVGAQGQRAAQQAFGLVVAACVPAIDQDVPELGGRRGVVRVDREQFAADRLRAARIALPTQQRRRPVARREVHRIARHRPAIRGHGCTPPADILEHFPEAAPRHTTVVLARRAERRRPSVMNAWCVRRYLIGRHSSVYPIVGGNMCAHIKRAILRRFDICRSKYLDARPKINGMSGITQHGAASIRDATP